MKKIKKYIFGKFYIYCYFREEGGSGKSSDLFLRQFDYFGGCAGKNSGIFSCKKRQKCLLKGKGQIIHCQYENYVFLVYFL